jgi:transcriptional regulator with XRE-family HTH domain
MGEKLRAARKNKNLSLRELAAKAEVSASLLSQIENGKTNPSVRSLHSIADALSLPVDYFFPNKRGAETEAKAVSGASSGSDLTASELRAGQEASELIDGPDRTFNDKDQRSKGPVMQANTRPTIELEGGVTWSRLTPGPEENAEYLYICYQVGASSGVRMSHHSGREFGLILEGELLLELGFEGYMLKPGDSVVFDSATPHRLTNTGQVPMRAIWVVFNRD